MVRTEVIRVETGIEKHTDELKFERTAVECGMSPKDSRLNAGSQAGGAVLRDCRTFWPWELVGRWGALRAGLSLRSELHFSQALCFTIYEDVSKTRYKFLPPQTMPCLPQGGLYPLNYAPKDMLQNPPSSGSLPDTWSQS